jgi:hypothetical protein
MEHRILTALGLFRGADQPAVLGRVLPGRRGGTEHFGRPLSSIPRGGIPAFPVAHFRH